jgi:hypothetical protein
LRKKNTIEVIKFRGDDGSEDSLLVVNKTPSRGTPGMPQNDSSMSSIEKSGSNNSSPIQADFSVIID